MSLAQGTAGAVHFPANPDKFEFDSDVARIFPDMARRAIPQYLAFHEAHVAMLEPWLSTTGRVSVLDVGASRGEFIQHIEKQQGRTRMMDRSIDVTAIDSQQSMVDFLKVDYPYANVQHMDVTGADFRADRTRYHIICASYVLQFIAPERQYDVLDALMDKLYTGGILIIGHKSAPSSTKHQSLYHAAHEEYIKFRIANGYTREEIEAKTHALKASMFPMNHESLMIYLAHHCREIQETSRWMMFSTVMAMK